MTIAKKGSAIIVKDGRIATNCECCKKCSATDLPYSDPKDEGTWTFSGTWPNVTWTFNANPGNENGRTWFFYGSSTTSNAAGFGATIDEITDWGNPCNWYSVNAGTRPDNVFFRNLTKRASRLPPDDADVFILGHIRTINTGPRTVRSAYICNGAFEAEMTATGQISGTNYNSLVLLATNGGTINGGASFFTGSVNSGIVNGGAEFNAATSNNTGGTVNGGALFKGGFADAKSYNTGIVNDGAEFLFGSDNAGTVNGGGTFRNSSRNVGTVNGGATFYNSSTNGIFGQNDVGTVNGGATFNDQSCSRRIVNGCFVAHQSDIPTCNTSTQLATCGCGC